MQRRTKRNLKRAAVALTVFFFFAVGLVAWTFLGRSSVVDGATLGNVRIIKDGRVSVGIFPIDHNEVALVDAGGDKAGKAILAELARRGLGPDNVTAILLTDGHPDQIAAVPLFPHAQVMALDREVALVEGAGRAHGPLSMLMPERPTGIKVTRMLHDDETILLGTEAVHVFAVPGHTAGSAAYLVDSVLFLGDAADIGLDHSLDLAPWLFSDSQEEDRESLTSLNRRLQPIADQVQAIECSHSGLITGGIGPLMQLARG